MKSLETIDSTTDNVTKVITHALHDSCRKIELDKAYIVPYVGGGQCMQTLTLKTSVYIN